jgi:cation:H+ antiporter
MTALAITLVLLLACAVVIYLSSEFFTNGVEWLGRSLSVSETATGTILAAFGTALPESVVTFVAVAFGVGVASKQIGVGAALGGPLALSTIGYAVVGGCLLTLRRELPRTEEARAQFRRLGRDQTWFLAIFAGKIGLGLVAFAGKALLGWLFLAAYALYARVELKGGRAEEETPAPERLRLAPRSATPALAMILLQTVGALAVIFVASRLFVDQLERLGPMLNMRPQLIALLGSPIATELPELMNAVIWVRQGKYRLALANISGAMMIQATVPTAFGILFTPWRLDPPLIAGAIATAIAISILAVTFSRGFASRRLLAAMGAIYLGFIAALVTLRL